MNIKKINHRFYYLGEKIIKYRWIIPAVFLIILGCSMGGLKSLNISTSYEDYFLEDDPMLIKTEEFKLIFGNDNYAAVLTECDDSFTAEHLQLIRDLSNEMMDSMTYADKITSLTDIEFMIGDSTGLRIEQIVPEMIPPTREELEMIRQKAFSKPEIAKRLISKDSRQSWIIMKLRPFPADSVWKKEKGALAPSAITGRELEKIITKPKYAELHPKGTGMPYVTDQKIQWIGREMPPILGSAILLSIIVLALFTRSFRGTIVPIITATSSILIVYGLLGYSSLTIDNGFMMVPILLTFAVAVAYNIHIYSFFSKELSEHGDRKKAAVETIGEIGWPTLFSALTTFVALLSFLVIPIVPMHFIGIATSSSVMLAFLITITLMPITLSFGGNKKPTVHMPSERKIRHREWTDRKLAVWGDWVGRRSKGIMIVFGIFTLVMAYQFTKIETSFDVEKTMGRKVPYVAKILDISESELGSLYSYDLVIDFKDNGKAKETENLKHLDTLISSIRGYPLTKRITSILDVIKDLNQTLHEGNPDFYKIPDNSDEIAQLLLLYENAGGSEAEYWIDYDYRELRINVEMDDYNSATAEQELTQVVKEAKQLFPDAMVTPVGSVPQFTSMMQYVVRGQITSFLISLCLIGILMMIVFGSIRIGLIGMIPNIMPAIVVGGVMGWLEYPLDMMTATIIPMILGLAVDDTIHFFNHGHLEFERYHNYQTAVSNTFVTVGRPLIMTTLIITANFLTYMISDSTSFVHMGLLSVAGMMTALLSDLMITPILFKTFKVFGKEKTTLK